MRERTYYTYIVASRTHVLYIGVTGAIERRMLQHKNKSFDGFTADYNCNRLVWFERYGDPRAAIAREKQLKGWRRAKKLALIEKMNPPGSTSAKDGANHCSRSQHRLYPARPDHRSFDCDAVAAGEGVSAQDDKARHARFSPSNNTCHPERSIRIVARAARNINFNRESKDLRFLPRFPPSFP
jgi:putative endonuclease